MTDVQVTQEGVEAWVSGTPDVRFTQIGVEAWILPIPPSAVMTQVGVEVWQSVALAPQGGPMISVIM